MVSLKTKVEDLRREHILDVALEAFAQHGFHGATIRSIAMAAGVSDGAVYGVYENKEALLMAVLQRLLLASQPVSALPAVTGDLGSVIRQMVEGRWAKLTGETLAMMRVVWSEALINRELGHRYLNEIVQPAMTVAALPLFDEQVKGGRIDATDVPVAMRLIVGSYLGLVLLRILGDEVLTERPEDFARPLADLLLRGLFRQEDSNAKS